MSNILQIPDERLYQVSRLVAANDDVADLAYLLTDVRRAHNGLGLAAPQIGVPLRMIAVNPGQCLGYPVMINPEIIKHGGNKSAGEEGCLSIEKGKRYFTVKRWDTITVRFQTAAGDVHEKVARGLAARLLQHEIDHLDGKLIGAAA